MPLYLQRAPLSYNNDRPLGIKQVFTHNNCFHLFIYLLLVRLWGKIFSLLLDYEASGFFNPCSSHFWPLIKTEILQLSENPLL